MARKRLRVLHVTDTLGMGGAETWIMELLRRWSSGSDVELDILLTSANDGIFDNEARALGARTFYVKYSRATLQHFVAEFRRILRAGRYDAIHDHQDYASGWHYLLGARALPPVRVTHVHNPWLNIAVQYQVSWSRRATARLGRSLVRRLATNVCGTSSDALRRYGFEPNGREGPQVSVAHCGFDVSKFNGPRDGDRRSVRDEFGWPDDTTIVLFGGRLDRALEFDNPANHKNSWFALNVVRAALERSPSVRLLMAGAGDEARARLEREIRAWGVEDQLRLIGVRLDMSRLMRASDVLLFPSREEGLGMVAVEAQAAGLPVLASTAVPAESVVIPELYDKLPLDGRVDEWVQALLARISKPRPPLDECRRRVEASAFSIENSAARLEAIYAGVSP